MHDRLNAIDIEARTANFQLLDGWQSGDFTNGEYVLLGFSPNINGLPSSLPILYLKKKSEYHK